MSVRIYNTAPGGGSGGVTPDIQQVLTAGNTANVSQVFDDLAGNTATMSLTLLGWLLEFVSSTGLQAGILPNGVIIRDVAGNQTSLSLANGFQAKQIASGFTNTVKFQILTANRAILIPDDTGTILLRHTSTFSGAPTTTTLITIPHGLSFTPSFATIVAKNNTTALALAGGYSVTYNSTNILIALSVATVAVSVTIDWLAIK